ncbi:MULTISPECIES: type II secretion system protein [Gammaproteobacteria]|uniref:type II secretion system protein n=1 Tax=Gammaproteobacteria TaxID=1236 RepID=UPI000DD059BB|nr:MULTISPECIES: prepilin-type N-terminal cleavage/methylation domain-containing protein [Gammaproteobacteria]RTE86878.1 prepilin-type N-terminal cleavage/methylation domain-containing protein [Aliidiomarina sp. B3213]TCZ93333.1 prepilin-type N-terminal cleavage/methylation domain-containing protein [Lysobacter sp. N42]
MKNVKGFTFIEVLAVLSIIALSTMGVLALRDWAASNARISEAKGQIATLQSGVQQWRPRNGIYTGISVEELSSIAAVPVSWDDGSAINPWGGDIEVEVDSSDATKYRVTITNISLEQEGERLVRDYSEISEDVSFSGDSVEIGFQG